MSIELIPLALYKANIELQLRISQLLQENGQRWLESVQHSNAEGIAETTAEIEALLRTGNWQALAMLPAENYWRQFQGRVSETKEANQLAVKNQAEFVASLQQALENWQKVVAETLNTNDAAQSVQDVFAQWSTAWPTLVGATPKKAARKRS